MKNYFLIFIIILGCQNKSTDIKSNSNQLIKRTQVENSTVYNIDIDSSTIYWVGKKITKSHDGTIKFSSGNIQIKNDIIVGGMFKVNMKSINNSDIKNIKSNQSLVNHLKNEDFFNVDEFPFSYLKIINSEKKSNNEYIFLAELTIKDIIHPITFNGTIDNKNNRFYSSIELTFDRTLWGIKYGSGKFFEAIGNRAILDDIDLKINIMTELIN